MKSDSTCALDTRTGEVLRYLKDKEGESYATRQAPRIAKTLGYSVDSIRRSLRTLISAGLAQKQVTYSEFGNNSKWGSNYTQIYYDAKGEAGI